jgi:ribose 5-phosphate isomerase B
MKIAVGSDHAGFEMKETVRRHLTDAGHEVDDFGTDSKESSDYPDFGAPAANAVGERCVDRGILFCGSGQGMCMVANRIPGVRAALAWSVEIAELSRRHNDANVLCLPARFVDEETALRIVDAWLMTEFEGGRHQRRVQKMMSYDMEDL